MGYPVVVDGAMVPSRTTRVERDNAQGFFSVHGKQIKGSLQSKLKPPPCHRSAVHLDSWPRCKWHEWEAATPLR